MLLVGILCLHLMAEKHQKVASRAMKRCISSPLQVNKNTSKIGSPFISLFSAFALLLSILCGTYLEAQEVPIVLLKSHPGSMSGYLMILSPFYRWRDKILRVNEVYLSLRIPVFLWSTNFWKRDFITSQEEKNTNKSQEGKWVSGWIFFFFNSELRK